MNAFSSPLEFVPFDYFISDVSTILVSNIWTWLAVFCAGAASFIWRAKSPVAAFPEGLEPEDPVACLVSAPSNPRTHVVPSNAAILESGTDGVTKGKFVAYYYYNSDEESENVCDDEQCESGEHAELVRLFKVERLERVKEMSEMGWYNCQDLSVLSGDVVRLWDARLLH